MPKARIKKYWEAISEATVQAMEMNPRLILMGEGVDDPKGCFGTTLEAFHRFGSARVIETPLSESAMTGIGIGAAISGHPCLMVHLRNEFLLLGADQVINHAAKWHYMFGGQTSVPLTIRCIVGRGWGQAAQHSQSFHGLFAQVPGLKVILPSSPYDAKGLLISAIRDPNPVICIEHRWLYEKKGEVPDDIYSVPIGKASVVTAGCHVTCVAISHQVHEAQVAEQHLRRDGIEMEVIDIRSARPLDIVTITNSVRKTGRLIVADIAPAFGGFSAEICAAVSELSFAELKAPPLRIALPEAPTPGGPTLENQYYPTFEHIIQAAKRLVSGKHARISVERAPSPSPEFSGPF